jgi:hypothetical protein
MDRRRQSEERMERHRDRRRTDCQARVKARKSDCWAPTNVPAHQLPAVGPPVVSVRQPLSWSSVLRQLLITCYRYMPYHLLQFAESIVGTLVSVLCNQALLVSVGVSAEGSIFGAVAVQWIIKDGAGEVAKLFFIRRFSPYFDR